MSFYRRLPLLVLLVASPVLGISTAYAEESPDGLWRDVADAGAASSRQAGPWHYRLLTLDLAGMRALLERAPPVPVGAGPGTPSPLVVTLPLPDGGFGRFAVEYAPVMAPALAAKYPQIRSYRGVGLDTAHATARLSVTPAGFNGHVLSPAGAIFVEPDRVGVDRVGVGDRYISYFRDDYRASGEPFRCGFDQVNDTSGVFRPVQPLVPSGDTLHNYRIAIASTGEYTQFHGGTVAGALGAMVTTLNRVNNIYERELAVRMELVADNDQLIFTDATTDPYSNRDGLLMLSENQTELDFTIGSANYDIGHVFSTGGGGIAGLGVVCGSGKARGVTGRAQPIGDPFDVDYVAHEIGHQFGATHTFNGTTDSCGGGNRTAATAFEPGSGTTIMAYAGICGAENVQLNSDAHFHAGSFDQIVDFVTSGSGSVCSLATATGNGAPLVETEPDVVIPAATPFTLTGAAVDPDGDELTYAWEEMDLGAPSPPQADDGTRPLFRTFVPMEMPTRTFPQWSDILDGTVTVGERLPTTNRDLEFRLSAFDNRLGGGGVDSGTMMVSVTTAAGPFEVVSPSASGVIWEAGTSETVIWNVANTHVPPVGCATVDIALSSDGGANFTETLAAGVPNDGEHPVVAPNVDTAAARVLVKCADSVFFDVSDEDFSVQGARLASDINQDGCVDRTDLKIVAILGVRLGFDSPFLDANGDGSVDFDDVIEVFVNFTNPGGEPCV